MRKVSLLLLLSCLFGCLCSHAQYLYGLDPTFANSGIYMGDTGASIKITMQQDGKIIMVGGELKNSKHAIAMRFNNDGTVDNGFADNGYLRRPLINTNGFVLRSVFLQPDGKILFGGTVDTGSTKEDFFLMRVKSDGTMDTSFGGGGYVMTSYINTWGVGASEPISSLTVQPDGKVLAYGRFNFLKDTLQIVRYHSNGNIDSSFGSNGRLKIADGFTYPRPNDIALMPDGRIVIGAKVKIAALNPPWGEDAFTAIRLLPNGELDTTFNHTGVAYTNTNLGWLIYCTSMRLQADGKILLAGHGDSLSIVRFDTSGKLDAGFGTNGLVKLEPAGRIKEIQLQPDGKIVVGSTLGDDSCIAIYRLLANGNLDNSFGVNGRIITHVPNQSSLNAIALQSEGKVVAGGAYDNGDNVYRLLLVRYTENATSVEHIKTEPQITIYPNPATDYIHINTPTSERPRSLKLYSTDGKLLRTQTHPNTNRLSTDGVADGMYYLHMTIANQAALVKKIVIQKQ